MIRNRLWLSPIWVQGLVRAGGFVVVVGAVVWVLYPMFVYRMGWPLAALSVVVLCAAATAAALYFQRPVRRRYQQALEGLDHERALAALDSLHTGAVSPDPETVSAAIEVGTLVQAYRRTATRRRRIVQRLIPAVLITWGIVELFRLPAVFGGLLIVVGLWWVLKLLVIARRRRRTDENLRLLRAVAPDPTAAGVIDEASLPQPRNGRTAAVLAVLVTAFMTLVWLVAFSQPPCNTVGDVMDLVYGQRQLADPQNMTRGEPDLATYRAWSTQLHRYADQVSDPRITPGLNRIAVLSDTAVNEFAKSRDHLVGGPPDYSLSDQQKAFTTTMNALFSEEKAVGAICFKH